MSDDNILQGYKILNLIGKGAIGEVFKCQDAQETIRAMKIIPKDLPIEYQKLLNEEAYPLLLLESKYVIQLIQVFTSRNQIYQILEYCDCKYPSYIEGTLEEYWLKQGKKIPVEQVIKFVGEILQALLSYSKMNIQYYDLSLKKILLNQDSIRLIDKGHTPVNFDSGTTAPEVKPGQYNLEANIFSLGCITYQILFGELPFGKGENYLQSVYMQFIDFERNDVQILEPLESLITGMLKADPQERFSAARIKNEITQLMSNESQQIILQIQTQQPKKSWFRVFRKKVGSYLKQKTMRKFELVGALFKIFDEISQTQYQSQTKINICLFIISKKCCQAWQKFITALHEGTLKIVEPSFYENFTNKEQQLMLNDIENNPQTIEYLKEEWQQEMNINFTENFEEIYIEAVKELIQLLKNEANQTGNNHSKKQIFQTINKLQIFIEFDSLYNADSDLTNTFNQIYKMNLIELVKNIKY